ncbi:MAG: acyl-[acyl-carrier-protein] thioesterase [Acidimicrobiales bacterium]
MSGLAPRPERGRAYTSRRTVRLGEVRPSGRARLDALARYLQDVAAEDVDDAGYSASVVWAVRRCVMEVGRYPRLGETVTLTTFCSGLGRKWAERRTSITGEGGGRVEAAALWVCLDQATGRPTSPGEQFLALYGESAGHRAVSPRLHHPDPPPGAAWRPWPLRASDIDVLGHVNNAVHWAAAEDERARLGLRFGPAWGEIEYRAAIEPSDAVSVVSVSEAGGSVVPSPATLDLWLVDGDSGIRASARLRAAESEPDRGPA